MNPYPDRPVGTAHFAAATLALLALAPLSAKTADLQSDLIVERLTQTVSVGDLDLTTDRGIQLAHERIHETARRLCARLQDMRNLDLGHHEAFVRCVDEAMASASADLSALAVEGQHHRGIRLTNEEIVR
jgi:UrcA family protein